MNHKIFLVSVLFCGIALACKPNTKTKIYDCENDNTISQEIATKANKEVESEMANCKDCCIKKISTKVAKKYNCKVEISDK